MSAMVAPLEPDDDAVALEKLNQQLRRMTEDYNHQPNPDIGGFTPDSLFRLFRTEWNEADCPLKFNTSLPLSDFNAAPVFVAMRKLLLFVQEKEGLALTAKGNLTRTVVTEVMDLFVTEEEKAKIFDYKQVVNEQDVFPLCRARHILEMAGMLRKSKGRIGVPKSKAPLLKEESAGKLAALLFTTHFTRFNLGYMSWLPEDLSQLQHDAAYALFTLGRQARTWTAIADLPEKILHPNTLEWFLERLPASGYPTREGALFRFLLDPFAEWGLVEGEKVLEHGIPTWKTLRVTPFYDQWIRFDGQSPPSC